MIKIIFNNFRKILIPCVIFLIIIGWIFSGWPQIYNFPPKVQEAFAALNDSTVEVLGGGGGGGIAAGAGGGGGGEYRRCTETLSVQSYTVTVGVGGTIDNTGETDSTFSGTGITMTADGGNGTNGVGAGSAGTGGVSTNCDTAVANFDGGTPGAGHGTGDVSGGAGGGAGYAGKGGNGQGRVTSDTVGGGGGGGAGESAAGGNASGATAGGGGAGGGGAGGIGVTTTYGAASNGANGIPATYHIVGGGGGGGGDNGTRGGACGAPGAGSGGGEITGAGNGCRGEIRIIYVDAEVSASGGTETTSGIYRIHTFTTSGTFTVSTVTSVVDTPTFTDATGTYNNDLSETITVASPAGSTICYTTDGSTPGAATAGTCDSSPTQTYSTAVPITATGTTLKAIGTKAGYANSAVQSATYTLQVVNPSFGTNGGSFYNDTATSFSSDTTGTVFCSTLDGSTPAAATPGTCSAGATGASATVIATGTAVKVLGTKANYVNSTVQTSNAFTLTVGAINSSPGAGTYGSTQSVTLSIATTTSAVAHYTTNGDAVTCSSTTYSGAFDVSVTTTVKAIGCKTNYVSDTAISDLYTIAVYSVSVEPTSVNYGGMAMNTTKASATITATVGNSDTKLNIIGTDATYTEGGKCGDGVCTWILSATLGEDQYVHAFTKNTGLSSGGTLGSDAASEWVALDKTGNQILAASVIANGSQNFKLDMRTPSTAGGETNLGSQYSTDITIIASAP